MKPEERDRDERRYLIHEESDGSDYPKSFPNDFSFLSLFSSPNVVVER